MSQATFDEWNKATGDKKLPEHVSKQKLKAKTAVRKASNKSSLKLGKVKRNSRIPAAGRTGRRA